MANTQSNSPSGCSQNPAASPPAPLLDAAAFGRCRLNFGCSPRFSGSPEREGNSDRSTKGQVIRFPGAA
jgi:hypothetical protein